MSPYDHWKTTDRLAEAPDPLEGKPRGFCPWCGSGIYTGIFVNAVTLHVRRNCERDGWNEDDAEDENRIRYTAQRLEESKLWNKIEKEGGER